MSVQSQEQTLSLISPDDKNKMDIDIYAAPNLPVYTEASTMFDSVDEDNPIYSEAIDPTAIMESRSHDYSSDNTEKFVSICFYLC